MQMQVSVDPELQFDFREETESLHRSQSHSKSKIQREKKLVNVP